MAAHTGLLYALSAMGTTSIERLAAADSNGRQWFQLYLWRDCEAGQDFDVRTRSAGYKTN